MRKVDVIVPVYRGVQETKECILSALRTIGREDGRLVVINDCSPEPDLVKWLESTASQKGFELLHNPQNLGFVATVNRGMQLNPLNDVLLLNSDVEVSGNWLSRMRQAAYHNDKTASLTPFSNNATICSFPNFCKDNELLFGMETKTIDEFFASHFSFSDLIKVPTGVGFCMYIRRDCLDAVGYFDVETFGKGYGEENDWCQRAERADWTNYHQANVFVYHKGGVSFDTELKPRQEKAGKLLVAKHPDYDAKVQDYIGNDPVRKYRVEALWKIFSNSSLPKILLVSHQYGGGVRQHALELSHFFKHKALFLLLTPLEEGKSVTLSICDNHKVLQDSIHFDVDAEYSELKELLINLGINRIHFHHTMGLHPRVWVMAKELGCEYDLTIHDYYFINGNPSLTDKQGRFVGELLEEELDIACAEAYPIPIPAKLWRQNCTPLVEGADRIIFPSFDLEKRFSKFFKIDNPVVAWHTDYINAQPYPPPAIEIKPQTPIKILVLGAISKEKGADILESVASRTENCEFHLLGYAYRSLDSSVITHGPYENHNVKLLIQKIQPDVVWFPAQCPETYSYTLSMSLEMGLPVVVPNIGAFAERIQGRGYSQVMPWNLTVAEWVAYWNQVYVTGNIEIENSQKSLFSSPNENFYTGHYLIDEISRESRPESIDPEQLIKHYSFISPVLTFKEKMLQLLWKLSQMPFLRKLANLIPYSIKRSLKRRLSGRPIHQLVQNKQSNL